jgi:uncharacterized damage-inducible protein DinB
MSENPTGTELEQLSLCLDTQREALLRKAEDLTIEQLAQPHPPSTLTLAGLLNHGALVEDWWFRVQYAGLPHDALWADVDFDEDPEWEFRTAVDVEADELRRRYRDACERSRGVVASADGLDSTGAAAFSNGNRFNLRWVLLHMIEETARHAGHADLIRESIDGATGE